MTRTIAPLLTGSLLALGACQRATPTVESRAAASASAVVRPSASARPSAAPSGSAGTSEAERQRARQYMEALARGRVLTRKSDFAAATAAFDEALRVIPGDARALGERGFARLQTGDLDGAESDFYGALDRRPGRAVLAATTYNLALVAERRGNKAQADELREAAKESHMPGRPACDATVRRGKSVFASGELRTLMTLRQVRDALSVGSPIEPPLPTSNEEDVLEKKMLGGKPGPWRFSSGFADHLLVGQRGDYRLRLYVSEERSGRCGGSTSRKVEVPDGGNPVVTEDTMMSMAHAMCSGPQKPGSDTITLHDCTGAPDEEPAGMACIDEAEVTHDVIVYDRTTGEPLLSVSQHRMGRDVERHPWPDGERVRLVPRADGVQLLGGGCNQLEPYVKAAPAGSAKAAPAGSAKAAPAGSTR